MAAVKPAQGAPTVPLLDLKAQYRTLEQDIKAAMEEVLQSQHFILGPKVVELESQVAHYSQCDFGIGVSSGTDALLLALMALDIGQGDAVITTPYSFFATAGVVHRVGARPVFCDIDPATYNLSAQSVREYLERRCRREGARVIDEASGAEIKVLMPVHLYGQCADMDPLLELAEEFGLRVVEDAAQAIGSECPGGRRAGGLGDIGCFSFFPSKNLGAFGDAGMCVTRDEALAERMRMLRTHGAKPKYYHALVGGNFRIDALQAAVLLVKLGHLDEWTAARQANARYYDEALGQAGLGDKLATPVALPGYRHIFNQYVLRVDKRDELRAHLGESGIGTEVYYPVSLHMQECFAYLGYAPEDCPQAAAAAASTVAIPIYPELTREQLGHTAASVAAFYA